MISYFRSSIPLLAKWAHRRCVQVGVTAQNCLSRERALFLRQVDGISIQDSTQQACQTAGRRPGSERSAAPRRRAPSAASMSSRIALDDTKIPSTQPNAGVMESTIPLHWGHVGASNDIRQSTLQTISDEKLSVPA